MFHFWPVFRPVPEAGATISHCSVSSKRFLRQGPAGFGRGGVREFEKMQTLGVLMPYCLVFENDMLIVAFGCGYGKGIVEFAIIRGVK